VDIAGIGKAVRAGRIEWYRHALERMLERGIKRTSVKKVLLSGEIVEDYPNAGPFPSALFLGFTKGQPLHVVAAFDEKTKACMIVTAYRPDPEHFEADYKTRRAQ
jgi:hypothetical protein